MRVNVDQDKCISSGQCVLSTPEVFDQRDSDGVVVLVTETPPAEHHEDVRQAARMCPALAITVDEALFHHAVLVVAGSSATGRVSA
jgi:ferredoxin